MARTPYDPENLVIVATGPLTGTLSPTAGRTIMTSLSPRTYPRPWHTHSTLGGWFGPALKYAGYDALVIRGRAAAPVYLDIHDGSVRLAEAGGLWGRGARATQLALRERLGNAAQILAIGPAGENRVRFATVQHAEENAAAHSGFGAVWGAKNLKAVAVRGSGGVAVARPDDLLREVLAAGKFKTTPSSSGLEPWGEISTWQPVCSQACTFNCRMNQHYRTEDGRLAPIVCIGLTWAHGGVSATHCEGGGVRVPPGVKFPDRDRCLHQQCNGLGLDLWFRLVMQPWFLRFRELGVTSIRGFALEPQDGGWFEAFLHGLAHWEGLGAHFADDLRRAMDELQGELVRLARAGRGRPMEQALASHFGLPCRADGTSIDEAGFSRLLDEYYAARSWDVERGWPTEAKLRSLGLGGVAKELLELRQAPIG